MFRKVFNLCTNIARRKSWPLHLKRTSDELLPAAIPRKFNAHFYSTNANKTNDAVAEDRQKKIIKAEVERLSAALARCPLNYFGVTFR